MQPTRSSDIVHAHAALSPAVVDALRNAVAHLDGRSEAPALHAAVCAAAREARARDIPPERLLVCFKAIWQSAAAHPAPDRDRRASVRVFDHMVSLCIREYFA